MNKTRPFSISKILVWEAYVKVKKRKGAPGIDGQTMEEFEKDLKNNLYKIWNRLSSGTYFPPPVKTVEIPKSDGKTRKLGVPTISDRIAQTVVKQVLEPKVEPIFHADSYGYRPGKSAHQAVDTAKKRCWKNKWAIDLDIKGFFDNLNHDLVMKAVKHHTKDPWVILYVERWLKCPIQETDGTISSRDKGTPQGGVISPLLANLYLHYTFDVWLGRTFPKATFERYADDIIIHTDDFLKAKKILQALEKRMKECHLELHPEKTKIVFCSQSLERKKTKSPQEFDFLGFTFKRRTIKTKNGVLRDGFLPGISKKALKEISKEINNWRLPTRSGSSLTEISKIVNPIIKGWINYYGPFYPAACRPIERQVRCNLIKWATRKYKRFRGKRTNAGKWITTLSKSAPHLFDVWRLI